MNSNPPVLADLIRPYQESARRADIEYERHLHRVYGANQAGEARYRAHHDDLHLTAARDAYRTASTLWHNKLREFRKLVAEHHQGLLANGE